MHVLRLCASEALLLLQIAFCFNEVPNMR